MARCSRKAARCWTRSFPRPRKDPTPTLLPPAGEGGAKRRMRGEQSELLFGPAPQSGKPEARFAALAPPHPPSGHLLPQAGEGLLSTCGRSEEHTSELQSQMRTSYAV